MATLLHYGGALLFLSSGNSLLFNLQNNECSNLMAYPLAPLDPRCGYNPDVLSNVVSMSERHGYRVKTYTLQTSDGYILNLFRVATSAGANSDKPPIYIQHGIATNSGPWVDIKNRSLAFNLADLGYDVWLGNLRGSTYSPDHVNLTVDDPKYWDFNLDTLAHIDIPQMLDLVANVTNRPGSIVYLGHSMGSTLGFMYSSTARLQIQGLVVLAPVVYLNGTIVDWISNVALPLAKVLPFRGVLYQETLVHDVLIKGCQIIPFVCTAALELVFGRTVHFSARDLLLYFSYWPSGTAVAQLEQFLQIAKSGRFQQFDYGTRANQQVYGSQQPPLYNLSAITIPVVGFYGESDSLYRRENLARLVSELGGTTKIFYRTPLNGSSSEAFDHIDFLYSDDINRSLYQDLFQALSSNFH